MKPSASSVIVIVYIQLAFLGLVLTVVRLSAAWGEDLLHVGLCGILRVRGNDVVDVGCFDAFLAYGNQSRFHRTALLRRYTRKKPCTRVRNLVIY